MKCDCKYIDDYIADIRCGKIKACAKIKKAMKLVDTKLSNPDVYIDVDNIEKAKELIERYFKMTLFPWELFVLSLSHCYYKSDDTLVFTEFFIMMGRGNGKNGFISGISWWFTTHYHGIEGYNVDIVANSEDQAKTSFEDIYNVLDTTWDKSKNFFYKSREIIKNIRTNSYIKYNTSNAKTKDGKRSACLIFDELHEYESSESVRVFRSGFGKRKHSRIYSITTNGYVREGMLDEKLAIAADVLNGEIPNSRLLPLIYMLDSDEEADNPENWEKANPSISYLPYLKLEIEQENEERKYDKAVELDFFTKRMNRPRAGQELPVTEWANIEATAKELPDLSGWQCTVGIDYASFRDWAAVNFHFKKDNERYDICHAWMCLQSPELNRIKAPWKRWAELGYVTPVYDVEISPFMLTDYIEQMGQTYHIRKVALDNFRYALMAEALKTIGISRERNNIYLVRPSDVMKVQPVIDSCFNKQYFVWGEQPHLRWATNNTKLVRAGKRMGSDTGNFYYAKIEAKSRKTDPFMALVASMTIEENITSAAYEIPDVGVYTY